jgi:uncharacterized membrane protein (DUF2068 family)
MKRLFRLSRLKPRITTSNSNRWIRAIAVFKLVKAVLLLALGLGAAALLHKDLADNLQHWITLLWLRQENRYVRTFLSWVIGRNSRDLRFFEVSTLVYSSLLCTEGIGLLLLKRWAEYLTVIITASFIPFELYTEIRHLTVTKTLVLLINIAVIWYLCSRLWGRAHRR